MRKKGAGERRLVVLAQAVAAYEKRFGVISPQELADQARADRDFAIVIRGHRAKSSESKTP